MSQRKLLLADDSVTIQKVVNLTFADEGIDVLAVGDGDSAMEQMNQFKPDLIMADVNMPGLNGYQICEKIKQSDDFNKTPVILLVGSFEPFDESEAQRVGADDFLTKPFQSIRQLVNKVTELLDSSNNTAEYPVDEDSENVTQTENNQPAAQFDDSTLDDEMIQSNHPGGFIFDEAQKFTSKEFEEPTEDYARTKPFSEEEIRQFYDSEKIDETADENPAEQSQTEAQPPENTQTMSKKFDEDVLELPPVDGLSSQENYSEANFRAAGMSGAASGQNQNTGSFAGSPQLSPETIDMIVQKVVEKLSDKAVKEVAWEVVPQMADLIIKKIAAEKFKE